MTVPTPVFSVIVPLYNTERYIEEALDSVIAQTYHDFEVVVVNDASTDTGPKIVEQYAARDKRIRMITQENRGLAGARNTGIRNARARYIALLDADDAFLPQKLEQHFKHLESNPHVGVSYAASVFMDDDSNLLNQRQVPRIKHIDAEHILCRNPVGNGSAAVIRRSTLDDVRFELDAPEGVRHCWFDENFRQSEDIEMWCRIATTTKWYFEGIDSTLTRYRISTGGLSANVDKQFETWLTFRDKLSKSAPGLVERAGQKAEAYQRRYLARRAAVSGDGSQALKLCGQSIQLHPKMLLEEPKRTVLTVGLAVLARLSPPRFFEGAKGYIFGAKEA